MSRMSTRKPPAHLRPKPGTKRERTRARLIEAAYELFRDKGIREVGLREVAARAGVTKGAIYGSFVNKDELISAVMEAKLPRRGPVFKPGLSPKELMHLYGSLLVAAAPSIEKEAQLAMDFDLYLASNPHMRGRAGEHLATGQQRLAEELKAALGKKRLPMPPEEFAVLLSALTGGLLYRRLMMPQIVTDEFIVRCFESLV
jgi:AcrR family transcriptional regulator